MNLILHVLSCHRRWAAFLHAVGLEFFFFIPLTHVLCVSSVGHAMPCFVEVRDNFRSGGNRTQVVRLNQQAPLSTS